MKTGEASKILGIDRGTLYNWLDHPLFEKYLSPSALLQDGTPQRTLLESDMLVLNTIRASRSRGITDWEQIAAVLERGVREQEFPQNAIGVDTRTVPVQQAEQSARALATVAERDTALARLSELTVENERLAEKLERLQQEKEAEVKALLREMGELQRQLASQEVVEKELDKKDTQIENLTRQLSELNRLIGKLEGQLEFLREQKSDQDA